MPVNFDVWASLDVDGTFSRIHDFESHSGLLSYSRAGGIWTGIVSEWTKFKHQDARSVESEDESEREPEDGRNVSGSVIFEDYRVDPAHTTRLMFGKVNLTG